MELTKRFLAALLLSALFAGCTAPSTAPEPAESLSAEVSEGPPGPTEQETQNFSGETGPWVLGNAPLGGNTEFIADFEEEGDLVRFDLIIEPVPVLYYSLRILAGPAEEEVVNYFVADQPTLTLDVRGKESPYRVILRPFLADTGFAWSANVTRYTVQDETLAPDELASTLEPRARSDNETLYWNASSGLLAGDVAPPEWTPSFEREANFTVIEVTLANAPIADVTLEVYVAEERIFTHELRGSPFHGLLAGFPGPYRLKVVPALGEPEVKWTAAITQFYSEEPESNWAVLHAKV